MNQKGFSLIESMVVVAIIGISAAMATPDFLAWMENEKVKSAASEIEAAMLFARSQAVSTGLEHRVVIDNKNMQVKVERGNASALSGSWILHRSADEFADVDSGIKVTYTGDGNATFPTSGICVFRPNGTVVKNTGGMLDNNSLVQITNGKKTYHVVITSSRTGNVITRNKSM